MISHLLLFSCVVLSVLFGSVVCTSGVDRREHSSYDVIPDCADWMAGLKMLHVTLVRHHLRNQKFEDGYVEATFQDDNIWFWDFYETKDWDRYTEKPKPGTSPTSPFDMNEIYSDMKRKGKTVTFSVMITETERAGIYSLTFADEMDAQKFTGEAFGLELLEFESFSIS